MHLSSELEIYFWKATAERVAAAKRLVSDKGSLRRDMAAAAAAISVAAATTREPLVRGGRCDIDIP